MNSTGTIVGTAIGCGLVATGIMLQVIPAIGTGTGAVAFTSGLAILGGGSVAAGGLGIAGGLVAFGGIITGSSALGAGASSGVIEVIKKAKKSMKAQELIKELRKHIPKITDSNEKVDDYGVIAKYTLLQSQQDQTIEDKEISIWLHVNEGYPYIDDSIVITDKKISHIIKGKIIVDCYLTDIIKLTKMDGSFFSWNKLSITTSQCDKFIPIKHDRVIDAIIKVINKLKA
jgi:hypothetical protein